MTDPREIAKMAVEYPHVGLHPGDCVRLGQAFLSQQQKMGEAAHCIEVAMERSDEMYLMDALRALGQS